MISSRLIIRRTPQLYGSIFSMSSYSTSGISGLGNAMYTNDKNTLDEYRSRASFSVERMRNLFEDEPSQAFRVCLCQCF